MEWNEENSPKHTIVRKNLNQKIWAYASDYTRLYALYTYGGFYLDTDIYLLKKLDPLSKESCVLAYEEKGWVNNGFSASSRGHWFMKDCMIKLSKKGHSKINPYISPELTTNVLKDHSEQFEFIEHKTKDILILMPDSFYPYNYKEVRMHKLDDLISNLSTDSYGIHLFSHSWKNSSTNYTIFERFILFYRKVITKLKITIKR